MNIKNKKGITLIALIVTIIVLIIIAGISIATLTADNGILRQTNAAKVSQIEGNAREQVKLACSAVRLAVAEAQAKDNSYSAKANSSAIQKTLIDVLQADKKDLTGNFSNGGTPAGNDLDEIKIVYVGDDYTQATNNPDAKITYTIGLSQKTVELKDEENVTLKDQNGNDVELDIGNNEGTGSVELPDNAAGLYETGSDYAVQLKTWQELLDEGIVHVENGVVYTDFDFDTWENSSSNDLTGDLMLPDGITAIGDYVYDSDTGMESGRYGFSNCYNLTGIKIPDSVTLISNSAFSDTGLTEITIPASVTKIDANAFGYCTSLTNITIEVQENNQILIGEYCFDGVSASNINLTYVSELSDGKTIEWIATDENGNEMVLGTGINIQVGDIPNVSFVLSCNLISIPTSGYLADVAQIGDYIDIGIEYENKASYSSNHYEIGNYVGTQGPIGWRVLSKNGNGEDGTVKLISGGIPLIFTYDDSKTEETINYLADLNKQISLVSQNTYEYGFKDNGFKNNNLNQIWSNCDYINLSAGVHTFTVDELEQAYFDITGINYTAVDDYYDTVGYRFSTTYMIQYAETQGKQIDKRTYDLLGIGLTYLLGGKTVDSNYLANIVGFKGSILGTNDYGWPYVWQNPGIRPVITLKAGLEISSTNKGTGLSSSSAYEIK